jgi:hypothetical protein
MQAQALGISADLLDATEINEIHAMAPEEGREG